MSKSRVRFCDDTFTMPGEFGRMRSSEDLLGDPAALRQRLNLDGYLYLKGVLNRKAVLGARRTILKYMYEHEGLEPGSRPLDGVMGQQGKTVPMLGRRQITHHSDVRAVLESPTLYRLYRDLFQQDATTFDYKWLRAVGNEEATGCHMDHVYMGRGSRSVMTCWVPFGDIPIHQGTLAVCPGSHADEAFARLRETYGRVDIDRDRMEGWFTKHPREVTQAFGGRWLTDDVQAGDVVTFGMHLMHASTTNTTEHWRLSCDVRFQPAADLMDERWVGESPRGHDPTLTAQTLKPMTDARAEWGL